MASSRSFGRGNRVVKYRTRCEFWGVDGKYYESGEIFSPRWPDGIVESCLQWGVIELYEEPDVVEIIASKPVIEAIEGDVDG